MGKRVVTGHDGDGKAVVVSEGEVEPITPDLTPGYEFQILWGGDETPSFPDDGSRPEAVEAAEIRSRTADKFPATSILSMLE